MALSIIDTGKQADAWTEIDWIGVQRAQFAHDEKHHREISRLSTQDRLRHMTLHFAKYAGRILDDPSEAIFKQTAVDTLIIAVSSANSLNLDISKTDAGDLPARLTKQGFSGRLVVSAGKMAAACEKLDHLEDFPYRRTLSDEVMAILKACIALFAAEGWDPSDAVKLRLTPIKAKSIFFGKE